VAIRTAPSRRSAGDPAPAAADPEADAAPSGGRDPAVGPPGAGASAAMRHPSHFPCFDGLRAFAALSVLLIHVTFVSGYTLRSSLGIYTARLEIGVSVFFLISGFLLYRPFAVSHLTGASSPAVGKFWMRRLLRIVPAYWLALTVTNYVLHVNKEGHSLFSVFAQYGFFQIYFPKEIFGGITQAWSLCTEISFYAFLPLFAALLAVRRPSAGRQLRRELVALVVLTAVSVAFRVWSYHLHTKLAGTMGDWLPANLDLFALGMLLAVLSAWYTHARPEPRWLRWRAVPWLSWATAAGCFWAVSHLGIRIVPLYVTSPGVNLARQALYGLFAFFLLLPAVFGPQDRGLIRGLLRCWPVASLGVISYGIYLWHQAWISMYLRWSGDHLFVIPVGRLVGIVAALAIAAATVSYFGLERPILRLKQRISWWDRNPPAPGVPPGTDPDPADRPAPATAVT